MSVSHALFIYLPSLPTDYTHKVEEATTLTPDSPPCMVIPTTANIHELKAAMLVAYILNNHLQLAANGAMTIPFPEFAPLVCISFFLLSGPVNSLFHHTPMQ